MRPILVEVLRIGYSKIPDGGPNMTSMDIRHVFTGKKGGVYIESHGELDRFCFRRWRENHCEYPFDLLVPDELIRWRNK